MASRITRLVLLFWICVVSNQNGLVTAFQAKTRETTTGAARPAFQMNKQPPHQPDVHHAASPPATAGHFAFAPAVSGYAYYEEEEDEVEISVGTAIVACAVSLALGFGLGYGT